ncbi:hypothetical protein M0R45_000757 [Rubus argutus]|uniref:Uncharacterized protein n=1 Tax=Rubus argutus TaxID=59490 RepID=A0AAW1VJZ5_RUBAR
MLSLGFTDHIIVEADGFSGGIWLFWNSTNIQVDFIDKNIQAITVKVAVPGGPSWMLSALYACPTKSVRAMLWSYFDNLMRIHKLPWIYIGDFNELYSATDKNLGTLSGRFGGLK